MNDMPIVRPGLRLIHAFRSKFISMKYVNGRLCVLTDRGAYLADKNLKRFRKVKV